MMQVTADLSTLSQEQRQSVANFILSYPSSLVEAPLADEEDEVVLPVFALPSEIVEDIADETEQPSPEAAFSAVPAAGPVLVPTPTDRIDAAGLPWDERIHASSRAKNADGTWRKKRGVEEAAVAQVEGELKALMAIPAAPEPVPAAPPAVIAKVQAEAPLPVPAPPAADARNAFVALISRASSAIGAKQLTQEELTAAVNAVGVASLPLLTNRLDLVPQVAATVEAYIAAHQ